MLRLGFRVGTRRSNRFQRHRRWMLARRSDVIVVDTRIPLHQGNNRARTSISKIERREHQYTHTIMYRESSSWKLATMVVMKGCPATVARMFRSLRTWNLRQIMHGVLLLMVGFITCSICFSLITIRNVSETAESDRAKVLTIHFAQYLQREDLLLITILRTGQLC